MSKNNINQLDFNFEIQERNGIVKDFTPLSSNVLWTSTLCELEKIYKTGVKELVEVEKLMSSESRSEYLKAYRGKTSKINKYLLKINEVMITKEANPLYVNNTSSLSDKALSLLNDRRISKERLGIQS